MIDFVEELLLAWGVEKISPSIEVGIPSQLGQVDEGAGGMGGHRCLSLVETYANASRLSLVVEQALLEIGNTLGLHGRQMAALADIRYAQRPVLLVEEQRRRLGMSRDVYRSRLDRLHVEVAARWKGLHALLDQVEGNSPAAQARLQWVVKVRKAARQAERKRADATAAQARQEGRRHRRAIVRRRDAVYRSSGWFKRSGSIRTGLQKHSDTGVFRRFTPCPLE